VSAWKKKRNSRDVNGTLFFLAADLREELVVFRNIATRKPKWGTSNHCHVTVFFV
jgi:hypothetical protein